MIREKYKEYQKANPKPKKGVKGGGRDKESYSQSESHR